MNRTQFENQERFDLSEGKVEYTDSGMKPGTYIHIEAAKKLKTSKIPYVIGFLLGVGVGSGLFTLLGILS